MRTSFAIPIAIVSTFALVLFGLSATSSFALGLAVLGAVRYIDFVRSR